MDLLRVYYTPLDTRRVDAKGLTLTLDPNSYRDHKDDAGLIAKIIKEHGNVESAIVNADTLRSYYDAHRLEIGEIISGKYPYSTVGDLVKQLAKATE